MTDELRNFLKGNQELLKKNNFKSLIEKAAVNDLRPELLDFLYGAGIDVLNFMTEIPKGMFKETSIAQIIVPENIDKIDDFGIWNCGVVRLTINNPNIKMTTRSVNNAGELQVVNLPDGMKAIPAEFCRSCWKLKKVRVPASVTRIGARAFSECSQDLIIVTPYRENQREKLIVPQSEVEFYKNHLRFTHAPKNVEVEDEI